MGTYGREKSNEKMKDIRLDREPNKYSKFALSSIMTNSQKDTSSFTKLPPRSQLVTNQALSADKNIPEINLKMNIKPRISFDNSTKNIINDERNFSVNNVIDKMYGTKKNLLNIVNLQVDDININSNSKQFKDDVDMIVSKKKISEKTKIVNPTIPSKLNYSGIKMPNRSTKISKSTIFNSKNNMTAVSPMLNDNDMPPLDDLIQHTIDEFNKSNKIFHSKFNWLDDTSSQEEQNNFDESSKKYDKSFLTNKYKAALRESLLSSSKLTKNSKPTFNYSPINMKTDKLSSWQTTKLKQLTKSSEALKCLKIDKKNIK